jgi:hypothetical protein
VGIAHHEEHELGAGALCHGGGFGERDARFLPSVEGNADAAQGGWRTPLVVRWCHRNRAGSVSDEPGGRARAGAATRAAHDHESRVRAPEAVDQVFRPAHDTAVRRARQQPGEGARGMRVVPDQDQRRG